MAPSNKRKKRTRAEIKERRLRDKPPQTPRFSLFTAVTEEELADRWTPETRQALIALCGDRVDAEDICYVAENILMQNIDPKNRAAVEAIADGMMRTRTPLPYRSQLIEAAMLAAVDPVFIAESGPDAPWRKEEPFAVLSR